MASLCSPDRAVGFQQIIGGSSSPAGYDAWLTQASTFGTVTTKERTAVSALFTTLNAAGIRTKLYQLYLLGGDDAAFANTAARMGKRGINVVNPTGTAITWTGTPTLANTSIQGAMVGNSGVTPASLSASASSFGYTLYGLDTSSIKAVGGYDGSNFFFTSGGTLLDYWGNPPVGATTPDTGVITSNSTTGIGTGIRTYKNGVLVGSGAGVAITLSAQNFYLFTNSTLGLNYDGRLVSGATHLGLDATDTAALSAALTAYQTAMADPVVAGGLFGYLPLLGRWLKGGV
jgi:hypothetical protein